MELKAYIAGKINPTSPFFGRHDWRDSFCKELSEKSGVEIVNIDPTKAEAGFDLDQNNQQLVFGRNAYMVKISDLVIVYLTDDISIGGSQEMLIAKHYKKPLIGIAPWGGKFNKPEKIILGKTYKNFLNAYVDVPCDAVVNDIDGVAEFIKNELPSLESIKGISAIDDAVKYYEDNFYNEDQYLHFD